ncbi:hypothetical protein GCM10020358_36200 [Amorphoplanes nipponensis]|uniref:Uncharacterized protein n=1 Tax=Actinoplanes nipponensis TaxID=135950 RepID=A0A919MNZ5_9ACTN|nr:DUF2064 domain-containing protein [Actinoplanes nipponensis]GIE48978.1 hypothetical protein Ani05nite_25120 [Actinoplanes nipponensis]
MTRSGAPYAGRPSRRTRDTSVVGRRPVGGRVHPCRPRRTPATWPCEVQVVTDLAGPASRLDRPWTGRQATMIAAAAAADTLRAVRAMPGWPIGVGPLATAFAGPGGAPGGTLLISPQVPQLSPGLLSDAAALLREFDAVLGPTTGAGWWAFGVREPSHGAALRAMPGALGSAAALTVAALRLGLRVAMLPTLRELGTGADVPAVAGHCPAAGEFAVTVAHLSGVRP